MVHSVELAVHKKLGMMHLGGFICSSWEEANIVLVYHVIARASGSENSTARHEFYILDWTFSKTATFYPHAHVQKNQSIPSL